MKSQRMSFSLASALRPLILACSLVFGSCGLHANLIANGSFEDPVVAPNSSNFGVTPTGWTGGAFLFNGQPLGWPAAPQDGNQYEDIGFAAQWSLSQSFSVVTPGQYLLSWYDNGSSGYGVDVTVTGNPTQSFGGTGAWAWSAHSFEVTLAPGQNVLSFTGNSQGSQDALIDNVSLVPAPAPVSSVPDAGSTLALLAASLGFLGFAFRIGAPVQAHSGFKAA